METKQPERNESNVRIAERTERTGEITNHKSKQTENNQQRIIKGNGNGTNVTKTE
jgi:ribosomal protein S28E/S33